MAKFRIPSQKSIDLYNRLIEQQNKVRKQLKRIHKNAEETLGTGRLPALIIPKSSKRIKRSYFEGLSPRELQRRLAIFRQKVAQAKALFATGLKSYLGKTVKEGYLDLWLEQIKDFSGESPEAFNGHMFSKEQIEKSEFRDFMLTYNRLFRLSPEAFLALLYTGKMISFKWIYEELKGTKNRHGYSWIEQQNDLLNTAGEDMHMTPEQFLKNLASQKKQKEALEQASEQDDEENARLSTKSGRGHNKSTYEEARRKAGK